MSVFKTIATTVFGLGLMGAVLSPAARADEWNRKTKLTFSGPIEIPGVHLKGWGILPAGTYVFKILDSQSDRHIVQIFSEDEKTVYATILAIPNYRLHATGKTVVTFSERPAGEPEALHAWFYPGMNWGEEFVYPKARAVELAKTTNTPVLFMTADIPLEVAQPTMTANEPVVVQMKQVPVMAYQPSGEQVAMADVVTPPPTMAPPPDAAPAAAAELPHTSSSSPLMALFGVLALGAALGIGLLQKRLA
jgi:LPXTG-motif cell wall-anchored protein